MADLAYQGADPWLTTGIQRRPLQELTRTDRTRNRLGRGTSARRTRRRPPEVLANLPHPCSANRMTSIAKAVLALELQR